MKALRIILIVGVLLIATLALVRCSDTSTNPNDQTNLEVREWGVLVGCAADSSYFLTSRPEASSLVRLPVIYIHTTDSTPITVRATFDNGGPTDTYPPGQMSARAVQWANVEPMPTFTGKLNSGQDYEPLENIIPVLNNVDANILEYNGWLSRFLFYEGSMTYHNPISATYDLDSLTARVQNLGSFTVYNVNFVVRLPNVYGPLPLAFFAHWDQLGPGQSAGANLGEEPAYSYLGDMVSQGFSQSEAESFAGLWERTFYLGSSLTGAANLVYRLPQAEYDKLISLSVTPTPEKLIRTLYVLIHLDSAMVPTETKQLLLGDWEWEQSCGGIFYHCYTPDSVGYTTTLHFLNDTLYTEDRNDSTILTTTYHLQTVVNGADTVTSLLIDDRMPLQVISVNDSTLVLNDECIDCFSHDYKRKVYDVVPWGSSRR